LPLILYKNFAQEFSVKNLESYGSSQHIYNLYDLINHFICHESTMKLIRFTRKKQLRHTSGHLHEIDHTS